MIRSILLAYCSLASLFAISQTYVVLELGDFANRPCAADSSTTVSHPEFWIAYATVDDQFGSAKDSSICVDWTRNQISVNGLTGNSRPIFIEYIGVDKTLEPNSSYSIEWIQGDPHYDSSYVVARYAIDLTYESVNVTRQVSIDQYNSAYSSLNVSSSCVITENMDAPLIASYIVAVNSDELTQRYNNSGFEDFPSIGFYQFPSVVNDVLEVESTRTRNSYIPVRNTNYLPTFLAHRLSGIPSPTNIDTFFVRAAYDPSGPDTVTLSVILKNDLLIQPFVDIAFENTADPNFTPPFEVSYETDFCMPFQLVERPVAPGDGIVFQGGQPIFGNKTACIQLNESSYLEVAEEQRVWYGQNSVGMLAIKADATIVLEPKSQMLFDGTLGLWMATGENAKIKVAQGAHLKFSEASVITHLRNLAPAGQIKVELSGGTIDLSGLTDEERRFFQISAKENVESSGEDFLSVWHQRSENRLAITSKRSISGLTINVYSLAGQLISSQVMETLLEDNTNIVVLPTDSPVSMKAVQFITDDGEQQTLTLLF